MSSFKTVQEFLKAVPAAMQHEEIYRRHVADVQNVEKQENLDLTIWEAGTVGVGERNLLRDLRVEDKFILPGFDSGFRLEACSWAKQREKALGKGSLSHEREYSEKFTVDGTLSLNAMAVSITDSMRPGVQIPDNAPLYQQLIAAVTNVRPNQLSGIAMSFIGERMVTRQDMRHVMLKGYLMTMGYNLAVTSGSQNCSYSELSGKIRRNISAEQKISTLMRHKIVVDECHFTREELWLLAEMCSPYPKKRYGDRNIYSGIVMEGDDLVILADDPNFHMGNQPGYCSPERMWADVISIAIKMNAMEDLAEVVGGMRGVPKLLFEIRGLTYKEAFLLDFSKSYSIGMGVAGLGLTTPIVNKNSGYYATSKCLLADYMLGQMMVMSMYNIAEQLAGFSTIGVPTGNAGQDKFFSSLLRQMGLKHESEENNALLQEWRGVRGGPFPVSAGGMLKDCVLRLTDEVRNGDSSRLRPQLLHALPFSRCADTTWGTIRGWDYPDYDFATGREQKLRNNILLKAFTWVMGVTTKVPKVGWNALGTMFMETLSNEEVKFCQLASGYYDLCMVRFRLMDDVSGRADEIELSSSHFYSSGFPGARCSIVFHQGGESIMQVEEDDMEEGTLSSFIGGSEKYDPGNNEVSYATFGGSKATLKGGEGDEDEFSFGSGEEDEYERLPHDVLGRKKNPDANEEEEEEEERDPPKGRRPGGVEYSKPKPVKYYANPPKYTDPQGKVLGKKCTSVDGKEVLIMPYAQPVTGNITSISGHVIQTSGLDNRCGIHAITQDLCARGFLNGDPKELYDTMVRTLESPSWYGSDELAAFLNSLGMGMVLIDEANNSIQHWGTKGAFHTVWIHYKDLHYSTFIPDPAGDRKFTNMKVQQEATTPESLKAALEEAQVLFDSSKLEETRRQIEKHFGFKSGKPKPKPDARDGSRGGRHGSRGRSQAGHAGRGRSEYHGGGGRSRGDAGRGRGDGKGPGASRTKSGTEAGKNNVASGDAGKKKDNSKEMPWGIPKDYQPTYEQPEATGNSRFT